MIKKIYNHFMSDNLYRGSVYLMLSTFSMAGFGFFFWIIIARMYSSAQIGLATTVLSSSSLIVNLSLLGFNNALIRYLPTSTRKNEKINTTFTCISILGVCLSILYLVFISKFSPNLIFLKANFGLSLIFIFFVVISILNTVSDSVFMASRATIYIFIIGLIMSITKFIFPFIFTSYGSLGVVYSVIMATSVSTLFDFVFMRKMGYRFFPVIKIDILKTIAKFSTSSYIASLIATLPANIIPIIVSNRLGVKEAAYYYMVMMMSNVIYTVPKSTTQSLFAEGAHEDTDLKFLILKSVKMIVLLFLPIILISVFFGNFVLGFFGKEYSIEDFRLLQLVSIAGIFYAINSILNAILNVHKKMRLIIYNCLISSVLQIVFVYFSISHGLVSLGWGLFTAQFISTFIFFIITIYSYQKSKNG